MINKEIQDIAGSLQKVVDENMKVALQSLEAIPEGSTKQSLQKLLKTAASGGITTQDAQKQIQKIMKDHADKN